MQKEAKLKKKYRSSNGEHVRATKKKRVSRSAGGDFLIVLMLVSIGAFMSLPFVLSVANAFKPLEEIFIFPPRFYAINPTFDNFKQLFRLSTNLWVPFSRYIFNSIFVSVIVTTFHIIFAAMCAYPLAKGNFPGRKQIFLIIQTALLFTGGTLAIPVYIVMSVLRMVDTYWALILPPIAGSLGLFLMRQFMLQIESETLESARIDGATELQIFWQVVMPLVKPAWLTLLIFSFKDIWNATGTSVIYSEELKMLPTALSQIATGGIARAGVGAAAALIMMIPPMIVFIISQSNVIETMSYSGIK
ncbi:MAG: carbohydrate ABC transporter permease [Clostridia bacterium]|nr:carbohydrate ABC transporter permease [Clostridia bacterium]